MGSASGPASGERNAIAALSGDHENDVIGAFASVTSRTERVAGSYTLICLSMNARSLEFGDQRGREPDAMRKGAADVGRAAMWMPPRRTYTYAPPSGLIWASDGDA